jgi:spore germination protein KB
MLVPFVNDRHRLFPAVVYGLLWQGAIWVIMGIAVTGLLGPVQHFLYFPFFSAVRLISVADFIERVDALILGAWFLGMFLRDGMILWALALGTAQWLGLKHYRPLVIPLAGLAVTGSIIIAEGFIELRGYLAPETFTPYMLLFIWIIPVLVLAIAALRGVKDRAGSTAVRGGAYPKNQ